MEQNILGAHPLFRRVPPNRLEKLAVRSELWTIGRGETAYEPHRFRRCLGVLLSGRLQVRREALLVSTLQAGDVFGAAALFNEQEEYPTTLTALEDCRLLLVPQEEIRALLYDCGGFAEVKGCTLEENGCCRFPDAPTLRGVKHLNELTACVADGLEAAVCFVIQMEGMKQFSPNDATHPAFGDALRSAKAAGVQVLALGCRVEPDSLCITHCVPVAL